MHKYIDFGGKVKPPHSTLRFHERICDLGEQGLTFRQGEPFLTGSQIVLCPRINFQEDCDDWAQFITTTFNPAEFMPLGAELRNYFLENPERLPPSWWGKEVVFANDMFSVPNGGYSRAVYTLDSAMDGTGVSGNYCDLLSRWDTLRYLAMAYRLN